MTKDEEIVHLKQRIIMPGIYWFFIIWYGVGLLYNVIEQVRLYRAGIDFYVIDLIMILFFSLFGAFLLLEYIDCVIDIFKKIINIPLIKGKRR